MMKFLEGKKTYIGLAVTLAGVFGLSEYVLPSEIEIAGESIMTLIGIAIAVYGRYVAKV